MILDIIGLSLIILFFVRGYMKGFIVAAFSVIAILLGIICSLKLSGTLATYLHEKDIISSGWAPLVSYLILFIGIILLVNLIAKAVESTMQAAMLGWVNRTIGGFVFAFLAAVLWSSILWLGNQMHLITEETTSASRTYWAFDGLAPWFFDKIGMLWPMAKEVFTELQDFFSDVNQALPQHVDTDR